jgi:hypothetical protein
MEGKSHPKLKRCSEKEKIDADGRICRINMANQKDQCDCKLL